MIVVIALAATLTGAPAIAVEPAEVDFGDIPPTEPVTVTVKVRNEGQRVLEIGDLRTSCGCTSAEAHSNRVTAGEETEIRITFDPKAHEGLYGQLLRIVYIQSNDPEMPELEIPVTVNVLSPQEVKP